MRKKRRLHRRERSHRNKIIVLSLFGLVLLLSCGYAAFQTQISINAKGTIKESSKVIKSWTSTDTTDFHSDFYKKNIVTITFLDTNNIPSNAVESWDVSEDGKGGVKAYVVESTITGKYDLYIGANNGVVASNNIDSLFKDFTEVTAINFDSNFDTSNVSSAGRVFYNCSSLKKLDLSSWNTQNLAYMGFMFRDCSSLSQIDFTGWNTSQVYSMQDTFYGCSSLTSLDLTNFNVENVQNFNATFLGCSSLTKLDLSNWNTKSATNMYDMFASCSNIISLNIDNFDTSLVTDMHLMFNGCSKLTELNLCSFNTANVTNMNLMFYGTSNLQNIYVGNAWTTANATTTSMFSYSNIYGVTTGQCN